jgi:glycosyltransferase involved in cell wall biosynthesis
MELTNKISIIIPSNHSHNELKKVINSIIQQTIKPIEIVLVDSSLDGGNIPSDIKIMCEEKKIELVYKYHKNAMPGYARNIGITISKGDILAFLDVKTMPLPYWLEESLFLLKNDSNIDGVWGATYFLANNKFEKIVRDGFFGILSRKTLPGTVLKRDVIKRAGHFVDWVRAGEDTDWMLRVKLLKINIIQKKDILIEYEGLIGINLKQIILKWYRNYSSSRELPHLFPLKLIIWLILYPLLIVIAFNWNYLIADWRIESPLYINHITKIVVFLPILFYTFTRGLIIPIIRGIKIWDLLPLRFILIMMICFIADIIKIYVLTKPKGGYKVS